MGYLARFTRGPYKIDISGNYALMPDFVPPTAQEIAITAGGTTANRYGGARLVGKAGRNATFAFTVRTLGASIAECERDLEVLDAFLREAGDEDTPIYFEYKADDSISAEPLWGQLGAYRRLEIISGQVSKDQRYGMGTINQRAQFGRISLEVKPYILGKRQRLVQAQGTIINDIIAIATGLQSGLVLTDAITNQMTNPVFGHSTWNTGWSVSNAELVAAQNINSNFYLFNKSSALLTTTGSTDRYYSQTINVGGTSNQAISCYAKRQDGAAVTSADMQLYYGGAIDTEYISIGNGWYWLVIAAGATIPGIAAGTATGVLVKAGHQVYIDGFMIATLDNPGKHMPFIYGDMIGCSWSGTAHNSTSASTNGLLSLPGSEINIAVGTFRVALRLNAQVLTAGNFYIFQDTGSKFAAYMDNAGLVNFTDGTNTATSSAIAITIGLFYVFHFTYSKTNGIKVYINGAVDGTNATFTLSSAVPTSLDIGTVTGGGATYFPGSFLEFSTFDVELTAAEILNDYNNIIEAAENNPVGFIPYLWTKDGDNIIDEYNDSTHDNFCVVAGVPGSAPADTILHIQNSAVNRGLTLANNAHETYIDMSDTFVDRQGTASTGALNGEAEVVSVNTTVVALPASTRISITDLNRSAFYNKQAYLWCSLKEAGSNLRGRIKCNFTSDLELSGSYQSLIATGALLNFLIGPLYMPYGPEGQFEWVGGSSTLNFYVDFYRTTAGAVNVHFDFYQLLSGQIAYIVSFGANTRDFLIRNGQVWAFDAGAATQRETPSYRGDAIEFVPNKINHLVVLSGNNAQTTVLAATSTITRAYVIPRYTIL